MYPFPRITIVAAAMWMTVTVMGAQERVHPLVGKKAPDFGVNTWQNLKPGQKSPSLDDYAGKIVVLYCFQSWCPGCHKHGFPTLKKMAEAFKKDDRVVFLAAQTVFEGFHTNTASKIPGIRKKYGLDIPFAQDDGGGKGSEIMKRYATRGTPWTIIIGPDRQVLYCGFHVDGDRAIAAFKEILAASSSAAKSTK